MQLCSFQNTFSTLIFPQLSQDNKKKATIQKETHSKAKTVTDSPHAKRAYSTDHSSEFIEQLNIKIKNKKIEIKTNK